MATKTHELCVMGVAGAGKTAVGSLLAAALGVPFLEGDDVHPASNVRKMARGTALTDEDRRPWLEAIAVRLAQAARTGTGLVVTCSALKRAYRDVLRRAAPHLQLVHLTGDPALIARRLATRAGHFMAPSLFDSQLATLEVPGPDERVWTFDAAQPVDSIVAQIVERLA